MEPLFDGRAVADFAASAGPVPSAAAQDVIVACVPCAGGFSAMGLCAAVFAHDVMLVVGVDTHTARFVQEEEDLARLFVEGLRSRADLCDARLVFVCERNTGLTASCLAVVMRKIPRVVCVRQRSATAVGWWTDYALINEYAKTFHSRLQNRAVQWADKVTCVNPWLDEGTRLATTRAALVDQLSRFCVCREEICDGLATSLMLAAVVHWCQNARSRK
jgi:hypothetical protein